MNQHVADLEEVALKAGEWKRVHPIAEIIPDPRVLVLVEIADGYPFAEEVGVEEPDEPSILATPAIANNGISADNLPRGVVASEAVQSEKPHHGQNSIAARVNMGSRPRISHKHAGLTKLKRDSAQNPRF